MFLDLLYVLGRVTPVSIQSDPSHLLWTPIIILSSLLDTSWSTQYNITSHLSFYVCTKYFFFPNLTSPRKFVGAKKFALNTYSRVSGCTLPFSAVLFRAHQVSFCQ
jgi:hypothetical protein